MECAKKTNVLALLLSAGNAWTDAGFDNEGAVDFWWTHALISDEVRDSLLHSCNFSGVGPLQQEAVGAASLTRNGKLEVSKPLIEASQSIVCFLVLLCLPARVWYMCLIACWGTSLTLCCSVNVYSKIQ